MFLAGDEGVFVGIKTVEDIGRAVKFITGDFSIAIGVVAGEDLVECGELSIAGIGLSGIGFAVRGGGDGCDGFLFAFEMEVEKLLDHGQDLGALESLAVSGTLDGVEMHAALGGFERIVEELALLEWHDGVFVAMDDEKWRIVGSDVGDGIGGCGLVGLFLYGAAE